MELTALPRRLRPVVREIIEDQYMNDGVRAMMEREREFDNPMSPLLAGIALNADARKYLDEWIDSMWLKESQEEVGMAPASRISQEVIIGGGLHAAIYAAVRVARGFPAPFVVERGARAGGIFAVSSEPSFYLNSRNRPGPLSIPGRQGALNVIPGAPIQPSDLGGAEYQTNAQLGWVVRMALAMNARVLPGRDVRSIGRGNAYRKGAKNLKLTLVDGATVWANRVIVATGLNDAKVMGNSGSRILSFADLMARMESPFPLEGLRRVAVVGAGDSGKTAIEALTGQGPTTRWSVASLDYPVQIDWYGVKDLGTTGTGMRQRWEECNRGRYRGIGRVLAEPSKPGRVRAMTTRAASIVQGYECVYVNEIPYDHVIVCLGFNGGPTVSLDRITDLFAVNGRFVAKKVNSDPIYVVGPAAQIDVGYSEQVALGNPDNPVQENSVALFRYADRTAALAASLPAPTREGDRPSDAIPF